MADLDIYEKTREQWTNIDAKIFPDAWDVIILANGLDQLTCLIDTSDIGRAAPRIMIEAFPPQWIYDALRDVARGNSWPPIKWPPKDASDEAKRRAKGRRENAISLGKVLLKEHPGYLDRLSTIFLKREGIIPEVESDLMYKLRMHVAYHFAYKFSTYWVLKTLVDGLRPRTPNRANGGRAAKRARRAKSSYKT